tara:strand:+ start:235 stop:1230 length:996 start_codon:yes stop_codon:yes gene_type:complete
MSGNSRLMYPTPAVRGPQSTNDADDISKDAQFGTKAIDYLRFTILDPEKGANPFNYVSGTGGQAGALQSGGGMFTQDQIYKTIYLYLPHRLAEQYGVNYEKASLGAFGAAGIGAIQGGNTDAANLETVLTNAADSAKSEIAFSAIAGVFNNLSSTLGLEGQISKNQISALAKGRVFNPYEETVFKGVNYRSHSFDFDMAPRDDKEAQAIEDIISTMRESMLPNTSGATSQWLTIPRFFKCEIMRFVQGGGESLNKPARLSKLLTFPTNMVLTQMNVDLTPSGQNTSLRKPNDPRDYGPASYRMSLTFDETAFVTRNLLTGEDTTKTETSNE